MKEQNDLEMKMIECESIDLSPMEYLNLSQKAADLLTAGTQLSYILYLIAADRDISRKPNLQWHNDCFMKTIKNLLIYHEQDTLSEMKEGRERFSIGEESFDALWTMLKAIQFERMVDESFG